jgi:hypothetical protein
MKTCPNPECPALAHARVPSEYQDHATICAECEATLVEGPGDPSLAPPVTEASAPTLSVGQRLLVTLLAPAVMLALSQLVLPSVRERTNAILEAAGDPLGNAAFSIVAMGITPLVNAFIWVEFAALIVPRWRPLRHGAGRRQLFFATLKVALLFAFLQSWGISQWLATVLPRGGTWPELALAERLTICVLLVIGAVASAGIAYGVHRFGLGNGIAVLLLWSSLVSSRRAARYLWNCWIYKEFGPLLVMALALAAIVGATIFILRMGGPRKQDEIGWLPYPTAGVVPMEEAKNTLSLLMLLRLTAWYDKPNIDWLVIFVLAGLLTVVFSLLFNRPDTMAAALLRQGRGGASDEAVEAAIEQSLRFAIKVSLGYVLGLTLIDGFVQRSYGGNIYLSAGAVATATAILYDLREEWGMRSRHPELTTIWSLHRGWEVGLVRDTLGAEGIPFLARGRCHRFLFHFFAPYIPIEIMVPAAQAEHAQDLLDRVLTPK